MPLQLTEYVDTVLRYGLKILHYKKNSTLPYSDYSTDVVIVDTN